MGTGISLASITTGSCDLGHLDQEKTVTTPCDRNVTQTNISCAVTFRAVKTKLLAFGRSIFNLTILLQ